MPGTTFIVYDGSAGQFRFRTPYLELELQIGWWWGSEMVDDTSPIPTDSLRTLESRNPAFHAPISHVTAARWDPNTNGWKARPVAPADPDGLPSVATCASD